ncbi:MAG: alpha/beta fold hydrolase [Candidatus Rokubacteria bacterium]|nr:alpha/beta fold hydrolase [Candidatus Rokubacteria bacterium]
MKLLLYAGVLLAGIVLMSFLNFWLAVRPPRIAVPGTPREYRLPSEDVTIETRDGIRLAAWLIPRASATRSPAASGDARAIILLHGYPAEKADMLPIAAALHGELTTLLVDLRYFGRSEGSATTLGHRERFDIVRAVDVLAARGFRAVGVFGYSLGGAVALLAAAEDPRIRAVVAYAPFSDLRVLGRDVYRIFWIAKYPLVELMLAWSRLFLGADISRPSPAMAAARLSIPVLLLASREDEQIPFAHAERLAEALRNNPRAELRLGRGLHNDRAPDFERRVAEFFVEHLR